MNIAFAGVIGVVLATSRQDDRPSLERSLTDIWKLVPVSTLDQAMRTLRGLSVPIVLCDERFDDLPWRVLLRAFLRARRRTRLILLSDQAGPELWSQFTRRGGFDLLTRPFAGEQALPTLISAYAQYPLRKVGCALSAPARNIAMDRSASR